MHIFVTGASGELGSRVTALLLARGDSVSGLARSLTSVEKVKKLGAIPVNGLLTDLEILRRESSKADAVIHCAFNHDDLTGLFMAKTCENDRNAIRAMMEGLTANKGSTHRKTFICIGGTFGMTGSDEEDRQHPNEHMPRYMSENLTWELASPSVKGIVVRLPPIVHYKGFLHPFLGGMVDAAKNSGVSGYIDENVKWPSAHYDDVADLCVLALDKAPNGKALHAVAEPGISTKDMAGWIGDELGMEVEQVPRNQAMGHFGFVGALLGVNDPSQAVKTKKWTGWSPGRQGLLEELKERGLPEYK